jgi:hypothetical protein
MITKIEGLTLTLIDLIAKLAVELPKAAEGNKAAARRARKATLDIAKVGKEYRAESVAKIG